MHRSSSTWSTTRSTHRCSSWQNPAACTSSADSRCSCSKARANSKSGPASPRLNQKWPVSLSSSFAAASVLLLAVMKVRLHPSPVSGIYPRTASTIGANGFPGPLSISPARDSIEVQPSTQRSLSMIPLMKTLSIVALASATLAAAEVASSSNDIVVLQPQDLPQLSRAAGQSMELLSPGNGRTYLYIEQQQLGQLLILDVTDMAHIKEAGVVKLDLPAAFDFASSAGPTASLIRFRGTGTCAILSYANPLHPTLSGATDPIHGTEAEPINRHGLLISESRIPSSTLPPRDYQIVDSSNLQS